jgi:hypothetical protein
MELKGSHQLSEALSVSVRMGSVNVRVRVDRVLLCPHGQLWKAMKPHVRVDRVRFSVGGHHVLILLHGR